MRDCHDKTISPFKDNMNSLPLTLVNIPLPRVHFHGLALALANMDHHMVNLKNLCACVTLVVKQCHFVMSWETDNKKRMFETAL